MELEVFFGYFGALVIGLVLGLTGGGGSILTVPVFVYILHIDPIMATAYSLFVVGSSSAVGAIEHFFKGRIDIKHSLVFSLPAVATIFVTRKYLLPGIPEQIITGPSFHIDKEMFIMTVFAVLMLAASLSMIMKKRVSQPLEIPSYRVPKSLLIILGGGTGLLTGLVGAGGGFIIVPFLMFFAKLGIKEAVGTSLFIISFNSLTGFLGDIGNTEMDWAFLLVFSLIAIVGVLLGISLSAHIDSARLKILFGWMVFAMGAYILWQEFSAMFN